MKILEENDSILLWDEENILCILFKKPVVDLELAKMSVSLRLKATNCSPCKLYLDPKNVKSMTKEARDYYTSDEAMQLADAAAVLSTSMITKLIATFFLSFNKPPKPFKIFTSKEKAFEWLKGF